MQSPLRYIRRVWSRLSQLRAKGPARHQRSELLLNRAFRQLIARIGINPLMYRPIRIWVYLSQGTAGAGSTPLCCHAVCTARGAPGIRLQTSLPQSQEAGRDRWDRLSVSHRITEEAQMPRTGSLGENHRSLTVASLPIPTLIRSARTDIFPR